MAKTKTSIEMDFQKAKNQADKLEEIAKSLDNLAKNDMQDNLNSIKSNWKSENADAYIKKGNAVKGNIESVSKSLREVANTIKKISKNTYDTEMRALELAKKRTK